MSVVDGPGRDDGQTVVAFTPDLTRHLKAGPELLVALDIDGTLLHYDGSIAPEVRHAVADVRDAGAHVVLATGRTTVAALPVLASLGMDRGWVVASNGAVSARLDPALPGGHEISDVVTFDPEPALRLLRGSVPDGLFAVEKLGEGFWVSHPFPPGELLEPTRVVDFEELCTAPASRVTLRAPSLAPADFRQVVERSGLVGVTYAIGWTAWLDLTPAGVSKASALETLRERLEVPAGATLAVGDGSNDVEMLRWASVGIAMGGAEDGVVAAADARTAPVEENGVVPVLRSLLP